MSNTTITNLPSTASESELVATSYIAMDVGSAETKKLPGNCIAPKKYGTNEIANLPDTITTFRAGDNIVVDGPSGTAKMSKDDLLKETAENALNSVHSLSDAATETDLVSGNYLALDGSAGTKKLPAEIFGNALNDIAKCKGDIFVYDTASAAITTDNYQLDFGSGAIVVADGDVRTYNVTEGEVYHIHGTFKTTNPGGAAAVILASSGSVGAHTKTRMPSVIWSAGTMAVDLLITIQSGETLLFVSGYVGYELSVELEVSRVKRLEDGVKIYDFFAYATGSYTNDTATSFYGFDGNNVNAIQRAIDAAKLLSDRLHQVIIHCVGVFVGDTADKFISRGWYNNFVSLYGCDYISLCGEGPDKTYILGKLPNNLSINYSEYQTLQAEGNHQHIANMTIGIENGRYPVHIDKSSSGENNDFEQVFENCYIFHDGNSGNATSWTSYHVIGLGICSGQNITCKGCTLRTDADPVFLHTNSIHQKNNPFRLEFDNCELVDTATGFSSLVVLQSLLNKITGEVVINGCSCIGSVAMVDSLYTNYPSQFRDVTLGIHMKGHSNGLLAFNGLKTKFQVIFKVTDKSSAHTLRYDTTSDGFTAICKGVSNLNGSTDKYGHVFVDDYAYRDGVVGRSAKCFGLKLNPESYGLSTTYTDQKLGNHLGDCSGINKTLGLILDGSPVSITFDRNYSSMSNDDVIADINSKLTGTGIEAYLGTISEDYYPELDTVVYANNTDSAITKGSCVSLKKLQDIVTCNGTKPVYGIALDDIPNYGRGRILTRGIISTDSADNFFVRIDTPTADKKYSCDATGKLVENVNGEFLCIINNDGSKKYIVLE